MLKWIKNALHKPSIKKGKNEKCKAEKKKRWEGDYRREKQRGAKAEEQFRRWDTLRRDGDRREGFAASRGRLFDSSSRRSESKPSLSSSFLFFFNSHDFPSTAKEKNIEKKWSFFRLTFRERERENERVMRALEFEIQGWIW